MRTQGSDRVAVCLYRQAFRFGNCRPFKITQWQTSAKPSLEVVVPLSKVLNRGSEWLKINSFHEADLSVRAFTRIRRPVRLGNRAPQALVFLRIAGHRADSVSMHPAWEITSLDVVRWVLPVQTSVGPLARSVGGVAELVASIDFVSLWDVVENHVWGGPANGQETQT